MSVLKLELFSHNRHDGGHCWEPRRRHDRDDDCRHTKRNSCDRDKDRHHGGC